MQKHSTKKHAKYSDFDLYGDIVRIRDAFSDTATHARGKAAAALSESFDNVKEKTSDLQGVMTDYITEKPIKSLGIALLSGYLLGALMMRKRVKYRRNA
jgi:ElaB/YqjD/DUF883 family membrane-anchored ribosome-binding protein